jgi:hypothetical protein
MGGFPNWDGKAAFLAQDEEGGGYRRFWILCGLSIILHLQACQHVC